MTKRQQKHYLLLLKQLNVLQMHPGIIAVMSKALTSGWEDHWIQELHMNTLVDIALIEATMIQALEHHSYLAQGYIVKQWKEVQALWEDTVGNQKTKHRWEKEVVICLKYFCMSVCLKLKFM